VDPGVRYLELVLGLRRIAPSLVEGYVGPQELAERVDAQAPPVPQLLGEQARELRASLGEHNLDGNRGVWLAEQLSALATAFDWLAGKRLSYRDLVERCHGITPVVVSEEQLTLAHRLLDDVLPGRGELRQRYQRWAGAQLVAPGLLLRGLQTLADDLRERTRARFGLPAGEEVIFELVTGQPWAGNAEYQGGLHTRVRINAERPIQSFRLLELVSHEAYPGHHTEQACKDARLIAGCGHIELGVYVYPTPQSLVSEGIAMHALEALLGDEGEHVAADLLAPLGISYDADVAHVLRQAHKLLLPIRANIAMLVDERAMSTEQARTYARRWMLDPDDQIDRSLDSILNRRWPAYESCYPEGLRLCEQYTASDPARFQMLLQEQLTTISLL
jgi:hypothetical protein